MLSPIKLQKSQLRMTSRELNAKGGHSTENGGLEVESACRTAATEFVHAFKLQESINCVSCKAFSEVLTCLPCY